VSPSNFLELFKLLSLSLWRIAIGDNLSEGCLPAWILFSFEASCLVRVISTFL